MTVSGVTDANRMGSAQSEVFDTERPFSLCSHLDDLPMRIRGAIGGQIYESSPIICYGAVSISEFTSMYFMVL